MQIGTAIIASSCWFLQTLKIKLPYNPAIPLLGLYLKEMKSLSQRDICKLVFSTIYSQYLTHGGNLKVSFG